MIIYLVLIVLAIAFLPAFASFLVSIASALGSGLLLVISHAYFGDMGFSGLVPLLLPVLTALVLCFLFLGVHEMTKDIDWKDPVDSIKRDSRAKWPPLIVLGLVSTWLFSYNYMRTPQLTALERCIEENTGSAGFVRQGWKTETNDGWRRRAPPSLTTYPIYESCLLERRVLLGVAEGYPGPKVLELADYREIVANAENECIGLVRSIVEPQANAYCNAQGVDDGSFLQKLTIYKTRKSPTSWKRDMDAGRTLHPESLVDDKIKYFCS